MNTERSCDECGKPLAPISLGVKMVPKHDDPGVQVLAIVIEATRRPPLIDGIPNPDHDAGDMVRVATWERGTELCLDDDCFHNAIDSLWKLAKKRTKELWAPQS